MERIRKALDKIHQQQPPATDQRVEVPSRTAADRAMPAPIAYTQTKRVEVSRELLHRNRVIAGFEPGPFVDAYKVLRTKVLQRMREQGWNALAITSPGPAAGKSLTAINLAISLSLEVNSTVLLVDANLRAPCLHRYLGIEPEYGLCDYLLDNIEVQDILLQPKGIERLLLLPGRRPLIESSEMLSSLKMARLVEELKSRYPTRFVVFDLAHLGTADALAFAPYVDATLLVAEEGKTNREELRQAVDLLNASRCIGVVLNKAEVTPKE